MCKEGKKVSVIVPVYNGEKYLKDTLDSILSQSLSDFEVICVDDGSTDASGKIISEYCKNDERVKLVCQENEHAGIARNNGMKHAEGKYLVFWDSDDLFDVNALQFMYEQIEYEQADICVCDALQYDNITKEKMRGPKYLNMEYLPKKSCFSKKDIPDKIFNFTTDVPWNKMYRKTFVEKNNLKFQDLVRANDHFFVLSAFMLAERITYVNKPLIFYRINHDTSLTASLSASPLCTYEAFVEAKKNLEKYGLWNNKDIRKSFANRCLNSLLYLLEKQTNYEAYKTIYQTLTRKGFEELGIQKWEEDYYYSKLNYGKLVKMLDCTVEEFLFLCALENKELVKKNKILEGKVRRIQNNKFYKVYAMLKKKCGFFGRK